MLTPIICRAAAMARRLLVAGNVKMWDVEVVVEWGDPPGMYLSLNGGLI